jgi:DNA-binding transcriptional LysR family regulator
MQLSMQYAQRAAAMMDLRHLRNLVALAEMSNFARAAASVNLSQSAFSRSIQSLERDLGFPLFDRSAQTVLLTPFGKTVFERAKRMLSEQKDLRRDINLMKNNEYGEASFGAGPLPAAVIVVPMLTEIAQQHPKLHIRVEFGYWQILLDRLIAEQLDFIIADIRELLHHPALAIEPLAHLRLRCFCRPAHPILKKKGLTARDLIAYPLASVTHPKMAFNDLCRHFGLGSGPDRLFSLECDNILVAEEVTLQSDMILVAPYFPPRGKLKKNLVELKPKQKIGQTTHFGIIELKSRTRSLAAAALIKSAERLCKAMESR